MNEPTRHKLGRVALLLIAGVAMTLAVHCARDNLGAGPPPKTAATAVGAASEPAGGQPAPVAASSGVPPSANQCSDGVDNDQDGFVDWQVDPGCYGPGDQTESALPREQENGFTTWNAGPDSMFVYVSADGDDKNSGLSTSAPLRTLGRAAAIVRDGHHDFIRLRRGDKFREQTLRRFKSGRGPDQPLVISSYGESMELPRVEVDNYLIDHNGLERSYLALVDLHLVDFKNDPKDPEFNGRGDGLLRFIGGGSNILVEGCHFQYGGFSVQASEGTKYSQVEIRHNVIEHAYHVGTCARSNKGNSSYRPSGLFTKGVDGLLIEGNLFDHNGWNEGVETACATIYNHNAYLNADRLVIRNNIFSRSSSIHIKLKENERGGMAGTLIENNFFFEGEVGVSIGGNHPGPLRFVDSKIRRNVFFAIGVSRPTKRALAWGVEVIDNERLEVSDNLFVHKANPELKNSYGLQVAGETEKDILITRNLFLGYQMRALRHLVAPGHEGVVIRENLLVSTEPTATMVHHVGPLNGYRFIANTYFSAAPEDHWFRVEKDWLDVGGWRAWSGETGGAAATLPTFANPEVSLTSYAASIGVRGFPELLERLYERTRFRPSRQLGAEAVNEHFRSGLAVR